MPEEIHMYDETKQQTSPKDNMDEMLNFGELELEGNELETELENLEDEGSDVSEGNQENDIDASSEEETPPEPKKDTVMIGGFEYSPEEVMQWKLDSENKKAWQKAQTERDQALKKMKTEEQSVLDELKKKMESNDENGAAELATYVKEMRKEMDELKKANDENQKRLQISSDRERLLQAKLAIEKKYNTTLPSIDTPDFAKYLSAAREVDPLELAYFKLHKDELVKKGKQKPTLTKIKSKSTTESSSKIPVPFGATLEEVKASIRASGLSEEEYLKHIG